MSEPNKKKQKLQLKIELQPTVNGRYRCLHILEKKSRQCNMTRRKGDKYCAQHKVVSLVGCLDYTGT